MFVRRDRRAVGKIVGRLSEVKLVTPLLASSENAGNLKLFWFQVSTFEFPEDPNLKREWFIKMKKIALRPRNIRSFV